jgi:putative GTP pyrophosphokinase
MRRFREAAGFQLRFNELWEQEDIRGLKELSAEIQELLGQLGKHEDGSES